MKEENIENEDMNEWRRRDESNEKISKYQTHQ